VDDADPASRNVRRLHFPRTAIVLPDARAAPIVALLQSAQAALRLRGQAKW
jgi:hypothetical protein